MFCSRRDFGKLTAAALAIPGGAFAVPNSKITGVQIGVITYSFRQGVPKADLPSVIGKIGLSSVELMSGDAEAMAGAPAAPQRADWRTKTTPATFETVRGQFNDQGVDLQILCYNMSVSITDEEIDYAFRMARALGVRAISSSSTVAVAKRVAPIAGKYKIMWGGHGHNNVTDPEQFGNEESFEKIMSFGDYIGANLDVGHYNQTGADAVSFIQRHYERITNVHIKDSKKFSDKLTPWGEGNAPIKPVLLLMRKNRLTFPANIEFEYTIPEGSDAVTEVGKCLDYVKACLAL